MLDFIFQKTDEGDWDNSKIADHFKELAELAGISLNELHRRAGVSHGTTSRYARGESLKTLDTLRRLQEAGEKAIKEAPCEAREAFEGGRE